MKRKNILDITNNIFKNIMSQEIGEIDYTENEYLNYGASYPERKEKSDREENRNNGSAER